MAKAINVPVTAQARFEVNGVPYAPSSPNLPLCTVYVTSDSTGLETVVLTDQATVNAGQSWWTYTLPAGSNTVAGTLRFLFSTTDSSVDEYADIVAGKALLEAYVNVDDSAATIAAAVGTRTVPESPTANTADALWRASGSSGDNLANNVPGNYAVGTAGYQLARIGSAGATVVSPVATTGAVTLYQNATYSTARGTALVWTLTTNIVLTGGTVTLDVAGESYDGAISGSAGAWVITVQLTAAQTSAMALGVTRYDLSATVSSEELPPLATGTVTVLKNV